MKKIIVIISALIIAAAIGYMFWQSSINNSPLSNSNFYSSENVKTNTIKNEPKNNSNNIINSFMIENMKVEILKEGTGAEAKNGDTVSVNYVGALTDGTKFDSSYDRNQAFSFSLGAGQVIKGWDLGVAGMKIGEKRRLTIPSELGYGATGTPGGPIPPNATLVFEVELLKINQ